MTEVKFRPLFPSPMGYANFGESVRELNKQIVYDIDTEMGISQGNTLEGKRTFSKNESSWQSQPRMEDRYESFSKLRDLIHKTQIPVLQQSGYENVAEQTHTRSLWANVCFDVGGYSRPHLHGTGHTLWSGVYYPKGLTEVVNLDDWDEGETFHYSMPANIDGMLVLFDPAKTTKQLIKSKDTSYSYFEYYGSEVSVIPRESLLILFPAWMLHMVTPLTKKQKRYSISFAINKNTDDRIL